MKIKNIKMKKISKIMIAIMAISIFSYQVYAGIIRILDSSNNVIASGDGRLPTGYYCSNHGWPASSYYKQYGGTIPYIDSDRSDLINSFIFSSSASESAKQNAFWQERATNVGHCMSPDLNEEAKILYSQAVHYADTMLSGHDLEASDAGDTQRFIRDGKFYYGFAANYDSALGETDIEFSKETKAFYGDLILNSTTQKTGLNSEDYYYYDYADDKFKAASSIYNMQIEFDYPSEVAQVRAKNPESKLYLVDAYGMTQELERPANDALNNTQFTRGTEFVAVDSEGNLACFERVRLNNYNNPAKYSLPGFDIEALLEANINKTVYKKLYNIKTESPIGKNAAKILATYDEESSQTVSSIGLGDPGANEAENLFYFTSIDLVAVGKDNKSMTKTFATESEISNILAATQTGNKLKFEVEVDENWYDAQSIEITVNYKYLVCAGNYTEFYGCNSEGEFTGSDTQVLVHPNAWREWKTGNFKINLGSGNRYINVEVDKYEGLEANKVTDKNSLKGAKFILRKGYFDGKDSDAAMNSVSYSDANSLFTAVNFTESKANPQTRNAWEIDGTNLNKFKWEDIRLETDDIETRGYVVFEITETPPEGYKGVDKFYIVSKIIDLESNKGYYYLSNTKILCNSDADLNKILLKENGKLQTDSYSINPIINVVNNKKGTAELKLLKLDTKNDPQNNVKFNIKIDRLNKGVVKDSEDIILTTADGSIDLSDLFGVAGLNGKTGGVAKAKAEIGDITSIRFTVDEDAASLPAHLKEIGTFTMEFAVKQTADGYVLSNTYVDESANSYVNSFKYNGNIVQFDSNTRYINDDETVCIGISNINTKDAAISLIIKDESIAFNFELIKKDIGTSNNVENVGFKIGVLRVDRANPNVNKGTIFEPTELFTNSEGKINDDRLKNLSLKDVNIDTEYIKVTIQETTPPKVNEDEYYETVKNGEEFAFIAKAERDGDKIYISEIIDKINWPDYVDGVTGYAEEPAVDKDTLSVKLNIKDKYKEDKNDGEYGIIIEKTDMNGNVITSAVNPAEFAIQIDGVDVENKNPTPGKPNTTFVATNGKIELDPATYPQLLLNNNNARKVSIMEIKAPDVDGDGIEDYNKINNGDWFTCTAEVALFGHTYRLNGNYTKQADWPVDDDPDNKSTATVRISNNHDIVITAKDEPINNGGFTFILEKFIEDGTTPLPGAKFDIEIKEDDTVVKTGNYTVDSEGKITIPDMELNRGTENVIVTMKETYAPNDYQLVNDGNPFSTRVPVEEATEYIRIKNEHYDTDCPSDATIDVTGNYIIHVKVIDRKAPIIPVSGEYDITLKKVREGTSIPVKDAWFTINVNGKYLENADSEIQQSTLDAMGLGELSGTQIFVTGDDGIIQTGKIPLKLNEATGLPENQDVALTEVKAPVGYLPINDGNPIQVTYTVKRVGDNLYLDSATSHTFFPLGYEENITNENYQVTLPEKATTYELKMFKLFKDNDGTVRKASFEVEDVINGETTYFNDIDTSSETSKELSITGANSSGIKLKVTETASPDNEGWGMIPPFYLEMRTKVSGGTYVIDTSVAPALSAVNAADAPNFDLIKNQLIKVTPAEDGLSIGMVLTNPLEGYYRIRLNKVDKDANNAAMRDVKFKVTIDGETIKDSNGNDYLTTDNDGIIAIPKRALTSASGSIAVNFHELTYAEGNTAIKYYKEIPDFTVTLNKTLEDQTYTIETNHVTDLPAGSDITVSITGEPRDRLVSVTVPNKRRIIRLSGQVWKDIVSSGKVSEVNGQKDSTEPFLNGITVKVHASDGSNILETYRSIVIDTEKKTGPQNVNGETKEGYYFFDVPMYDGAYYIEYIYNGYKYQHTKYTPWNGSAVYSNATETELDRDNLNNQFAIINSGSVSNEINNTEEPDTSFSGVNIGISAFTGGFGSKNLATYSASKYDASEGKCDNKAGAGNSTNYVNASAANTTIDGKQYDYVYDNIDLGIAARERVRMLLSKDVYQVKFYSPERDITQVYTTNATEDDYKYEEYVGGKYKDFVGAMDIGVKPEDARTLEGNGDTGDNNAPDVHTYITYRLYLKNNSPEIDIRFNDIVDYFDDSLTLLSVKDSSGTDIGYTIKEGNKALRIFDADGANTGTTRDSFKELHISPNMLVANNGATNYIYLTFEMPTTEENIILDGDTPEIINQKLKINVAEVNSYSTYYAFDGINAENPYTYNEHKIGIEAGLFDEASNPGNVNGIQQTGIARYPYIAYPHEPDDGIAFIRFKEMEERVLSGVVWKDARTVNSANAIIGNGKYDSGEETYEGVKVQLFDIDTDKIARVHYLDKKGTPDEWGDAICQTTGSDGKYKFTGVAPGHYYMIFTYPDGQTYKSTIVGDTLSSTAEDAVDDANNATFDFANANTDYLNASHARDIYKAEHYSTDGTKRTDRTRTYVNNLLGATGEINNHNDDDKKIGNDYGAYTAATNEYIKMDSISSRLNVDFETNSGDESPYALNFEGGITWSYLRMFDVKNINLGVVERPISQLTMTKDVDNIKLTLADGSIQFDTSANPADKATNVQKILPTEFAPTYDGVDNKQLKAIDNSPIPGIPNWRSGLKKGNVNLIMDEELIQGATIKIRYNIKVTNVGEIDYKDTKFYYTGVEDDASTNLVKTQIKEVVDYVGYQADSSDNATRNNLNYIKEDNEGLNWNVVTLDSLTSAGKLSSAAANGTEYALDPTAAKAGASVYTTIVTNGMDDKILQPELFNPDESTIVKKLTLSKTLSSSAQSDDLTYNNIAEITHLKNDVGRRTRYSTVGNQDPTSEHGPSEVDTDEAQEVTIMPPYGQTQIPYMLYAGIAGILVLGIFGIIQLRKKTASEE